MPESDARSVITLYSHHCQQAQSKPPIDPVAALPRQGRTRDPGAGVRWYTHIYTHILCSYGYECSYTTHNFIRASIVYSHRCLQAQSRPPVDPIAVLPRQGRTRDPGAGARWPTLLLPSPACCPDWGAASERG